MYVKALCLAYCKDLVYIGFPRWPLTSSYLGERSSRAWRPDKLRKEIRSEIPELSSQENWSRARRTIFYDGGVFATLPMVLRLCLVCVSVFGLGLT